MNIKEAKEQIKNAMTAYFTKNELNEYVVPIERQRPVFLMGPPGIGKTAIMEQVAAELGVALLSYSMTHHTRQSALGLPFIAHKNYKGREYDISEYTMSEIIASIYELMETTGVEEGILFLDEINCVSETLAPIMLQFLQYKVFGRHKVPEGWIVVTAGNPPEYNNSVREFDVVTWDRLKRIDVEPDFSVWKEYAFKKSVHPSIMTFLEIKKDCFYRVETTVDGKSFVTARGWDDLSQMILLYEQHGITVDDKLIGQYVQNKQIAQEFAIYYDLFQKYKSDYQVPAILEGRADERTKKRAMEAKFDERLSLMGLILDSIGEEIRTVIDMEQLLRMQMEVFKTLRAKLATGTEPVDALEKLISEKQKAVEYGKSAGNISAHDRSVMKRLILELTHQRELIKDEKPADAFKVLKKNFDTRVAALKKLAGSTGEKLTNIFTFFEEVFGEGQELLILVTELTANANSALFISRYGCEKYFKHNKDLLLYERQKDIIREIEELGL